MKIDLVKVNPLQHHKSLKIDKELQVPFSEAEVAEVLSALEEVTDFESARDKLMIELLIEL